MSFATTTPNSLHPLITQTLVQTKKYYCPFLDRGFCREGSRCNFSHEFHNAIKIPTNYCHFYIANQCLYGIECKFRHAEPPLPSTTSPSFSLSFSEARSSSTNPGSSNTSSSQQHSYEDDEDVDDEEDEEEEDEDEDVVEAEEPGQEQETYKSRDPTTLFALMAIAGDMGNISAVTNHHDDEFNFETVDFQGGEYSGNCSEEQLLVCDLCERDCLDPYNLEQQRQHREDCLREHEREMELSFAVQRSRDKVCGICMDTVIEKKPITSSRFGILEKCNHIFCLDCIRKWRGTKQFETRTIRACPECRVSSDFVVPSKYWVEDQDDKEKLIHDYKEALRTKPCKYFDEGRGNCPFAGSCFYKHAYPDGRIAELERPRRYKHRGGNPRSVANYILWNILQSADEDDWSNDDFVSLYLDTDYAYTDDDDEDDYEIDDDDLEISIYSEESNHEYDDNESEVVDREDEDEDAPQVDNNDRREDGNVDGDDRQRAGEEEEEEETLADDVIIIATRVQLTPRNIEF